MTPYSPPPTTNQRAALLNLLGLLLIVLGSGGLVTAAWFTDWRLGLVAASLAVGAVGWQLATSEA